MTIVTIVPRPTQNMLFFLKQLFIVGAILGHDGFKFISDKSFWNVLSY